MDKLIEVEDLLSEPRVIEAFIEMDKVSLYHHWDDKGYRHIPLSIADLAFFMRNATMGKESRDMPGGWNRIVGELVGHGDTGSLLLSEPRHWIVAAVVVWEANNGKGDKSTINPYGGED